MSNLIGKKFNDSDRFPTGGPDEPWFTYDAVVLFDKLLRKDYKVFEWGSGASTTWMASRVKEIVSIERGEKWYARVRKALEEKYIKNVNLRYEILKDGNYITCINEYPDEYFDVIVVDGASGKYRIGAIIAAVPKLKTSGLLLVDDSNYVKHIDKVDFLRYWPSVDTFNNKRSTTFFFKPKDATNESFRRYLKPK